MEKDKKSHTNESWNYLEAIKGEYPAGKFWFPGCPEDIPLQSPQNVP